MAVLRLFFSMWKIAFPRLLPYCSAIAEWALAAAPGLPPNCGLYLESGKG